MNKNKNKNKHRLFIFLLALFLSFSTSLASYLITTVNGSISDCVNDLEPVTNSDQFCIPDAANRSVSHGFPQDYYWNYYAEADYFDIVGFMINTATWFVFWILVILLVNFVIKRIKKEPNATL